MKPISKKQALQAFGREKRVWVDKTIRTINTEIVKGYNGSSPVQVEIDVPRRFSIVWVVSLFLSGGWTVETSDPDVSGSVTVTLS